MITKNVSTRQKGPRLHVVTDRSLIELLAVSEDINEANDSITQSYARRADVAENQECILGTSSASIAPTTSPPSTSSKEVARRPAATKKAAPKASSSKQPPVRKPPQKKARKSGQAKEALASGSKTMEETPSKAVAPIVLEKPLVVVRAPKRPKSPSERGWCAMSLFRFHTLMGQFRPSKHNFSFHIAAVTHRMLNVYEDEEETDLHDFLTYEDLSTMASHKSDNDEQFTLIFQPKYRLRPDGQMVREKLEEYVNTANVRSKVELGEDGDFFADAWNKRSNPFHATCVGKGATAKAKKR